MEHTLESVTTTIKAIVAQTLKVKSDDFSLDTPLREELGADSLDAISISLDVDDAFGIHVNDVELSQFNTCRSIVSAVSRHLNIETPAQNRMSA